jgi:hypothetical protein
MVKHSRLLIRGLSMANKLQSDGIGGKGMTIRQFAETTGLPELKILDYCRKGRIFGARKHARTKKWWIYPPAKILYG